MGLDFASIEGKWQKKWSEARVFESNVEEKEKFFVTFPIPYCNGSPHIGHGFTFSRVDAYARFKRMQGYNVLYPQGFHATGEPILGSIERLQQGDQTQIETFKMYGATQQDMEDFVKKGPEFAARYWMSKWKEHFERMGCSIDWRRSFITALDAGFNKFIEWQYETLKKNGFVTQGTHPVVWCPHDESPTGDHDRLVGEGESPAEYTIIKFRMDDGSVIPCGTLRPETVFGVTNIWITPDVDYVRANVDGENWILSERAAIKLGDQLKNVTIKDRVKGSELVGKKARNPVNSESVYMLPASTVNQNIATGIVMSVPSHAPYDWANLHDLRKYPDSLKKYNVDPKIIDEVSPVSIIKTPGMGEHPAIEIVQKMLILSQDETEKLEKATSEIYKKEFYEGVLRENTGKYSGRKVSEVKEALIEDLRSRRAADTIWELTGKVVCRCKTENHVKILEDQWFLKFSDEKWKADVKNCISEMKFYPEEARSQFLNTVDWLKDKACARRAGLGTKMPWDKEWIIETLSDSTIYMAYYTIARIINESGIGNDLNNDVFDYILLGKGDLKVVSKGSGINQDVLKEMKREFEYFYPVDMRNSGKDLLQNHLTYFLFHHTAIWPKDKWPRSIGINGFVNVSGEKMSKSKGNFIPLRNALEKHGADIVRMTIASSNEGMDDADWKEEMVESFSSRMNYVYDIASRLSEAKSKDTLTIDRCVRSRANKYIREATDAYEGMKMRSAIQSAFFEFTNDIKSYISKRGGVENCNPETLGYVLSIFTRLVSPMAPHYSEEMWSVLGNDGFVCIAQWPTYSESEIDTRSENAESLVEATIQDIIQIKKLTGIEPKEVRVIVADEAKFSAYKTVVSNKDKDLKALIGLLKNKNEQIVKYVQSLSKKIHELPTEILERDEQLNALSSSKDYIERQTGSKIILEHAEDSKVDKAKNADVIKPAIFLGK